MNQAFFSLSRLHQEHTKHQSLDLAWSMNLHFENGLMVIGWLILILILAGLAAIAVWTFKWFSKHSAPKKQDQMDIARKRYAKGEITKEQFERIKKI